MAILTIQSPRLDHAVLEKVSDPSITVLHLDHVQFSMDTIKLLALAMQNPMITEWRFDGCQFDSDGVICPTHYLPALAKLIATHSHLLSLEFKNSDSVDMEPLQQGLLANQTIQQVTLDWNQPRTPGIAETITAVLQIPSLLSFTLSNYELLPEQSKPFADALRHAKQLRAISLPHFSLVTSDTHVMSDQENIKNETRISMETLMEGLKACTSLRQVALQNMSLTIDPEKYIPIETYPAYSLALHLQMYFSVKCLLDGLQQMKLTDLALSIDFHKNFINQDHKLLRDYAEAEKQLQAKADQYRKELRKVSFLMGAKQKESSVHRFFNHYLFDQNVMTLVFCDAELRDRKRFVR